MCISRYSPSRMLGWLAVVDWLSTIRKTTSFIPLLCVDCRLGRPIWADPWPAIPLTIEHFWPTHVASCVCTQWCAGIFLCLRNWHFLLEVPPFWRQGPPFLMGILWRERDRMRKRETAWQKYCGERPAYSWELFVDGMKLVCVFWHSAREWICHYKRRCAVSNPCSHITVTGMCCRDAMI